MASQRSDVRTGVIAAVAAYTCWGFFPLYFLALKQVSAYELLADRILFAVPFGAVIIWARGQSGEVLAGLRDKRVLGALFVSSAFIAVNWLVYILAVQNGRIFEASLGYYINPLIYVLVGVVLLRERLRPGQIVAVALATLGVAILTGGGAGFPIVSLVLAVSFTIYGYVRKQASIGAMPGLFIETLLLAPLAAIGLYWLAARGDAVVIGAGPGLLAMLALAGPATVIPLLFFAVGARRLTLATLGFLQFIGPTIQFVVGLWAGEAFTPAHQICFALIWTAAAVFAFDAWLTHGRGRRTRAAEPA